MTEIVPAAPADAAAIARLVLLSAETFLPAVFGGGVEGAMRGLAAGRRTLFSFRHAAVARDGSRTVGMVLGYAGPEKAREDPATGLGLLAALGPRMLGRLGPLLALQRTIGRLERDEWYVSNLAVFPADRGRGVGRLLMEAAESRAAGCRDCARVVLDVETDHALAISFYTSLGYAVVKESPPVRVEGRSFRFLRMRKELHG
jgi:ribosomal protein S18 acetylase RimI-like enzyme